MATFDFYGRAIDADVPAFLVPVVQRGLRVVGSNEAMSKANAEIVKTLRNGDDKRKVSTDEITAWRDANADAYDAMLDKIRADLHTKIIAGELGVGRASDGLTAAERMRHEAAEQTLVELYAELSKKNGKTIAPFLTMNAHKAAIGHKGKATDEMTEHVAGEKRAKIEAFLAGLAPDGKFAKHARRFDRHLERIKAERAADKAPAAEIASDDMAELA